MTLAGQTFHPKEKVDFQQMLKYETQANNTSNLVSEVLGKMKYCNDDINTIIRLINAADKHNSKEMMKQ